MNAPEGTPPLPGINVIPGSITQASGTGCIEYYVYAIASGGTTVSYDRLATITIIKDAYTDPITGMTAPPVELEQYILTVPAGAHVSANQRILFDATEEYDQDFTYKVESFTDTAGNPLTGYTLFERTYAISNNCFTNQGNGGSETYLFGECTDPPTESGGTGSTNTTGSATCEEVIDP